MVQVSSRSFTYVKLSLREDPGNGTRLTFYISCTALPRQILSLAEISGSSSSPFQLSSLERLGISDEASLGCWKDDTKNTGWLELLQILPM